MFAVSLPNEAGTTFLAAYARSSPHIQRNVPAANRALPPACGRNTAAAEPFRP
jgi:hypothetical protein